MTLLKRNHSFCSAEILSLIREVGYLKPTLLQQRIVPLILKGKDVAVEAEGGSGKTIAFILPIVLRVRKGRPGIKAIIFTSNLENSRKIFREFKRFCSSGKSNLSLFAFGIDENVRKEYRILSRGPDVLIGTPDRVIDHFRRGNLHFSHLQIVIIDALLGGKNLTPEFDEDIIFIFSKFPQKLQTVLFSPSFEAGTESLISLLKRPLMIPVSVWKESVPPLEEEFIEASESQKFFELPNLILSKNMESLLILCMSPLNVKRITKILRKQQFKVLYLLDDLPSVKQNMVCKAFSGGRASILVSTFDAIQQKSLKWITHIINLDLPPKPEAYGIKGFVLRMIITLGTEEQYFQLQETRKVQITKREFPTEDQVIRGSIQQILKRIREEEDPIELNRFRKIVRKNVPIFLRSYFAAYLFKSTISPAAGERNNFTKLFVGVGKSRRVYPKDLINLFMNKLRLSRSQIGEVKVLDNYSFIDIHSSYAEKAISGISGIEFNGRRITVNFARKKAEK